MMPPPVQAKADAQLAALWPPLQTDEAAYLAAHDGYWQGLRTHQAEIPADGADVLPDVGALTPTDQPDPWPPAYVGNPISMALTVDVRDGPMGMTFVLTALVNISRNPNDPPPQARVLWHRVLAVGAEANVLAHDWELVPIADPLG
jgi:hypothetical protein